MILGDSPLGSTPLGAGEAAAGGDTTAPVLSTAVIPAAGTTCILTYDEALDTGSIPAIGDFSFSGGNGVIAVDTGGVAVAGSAVTLTLDRTISDSETGITVSYTAGVNPIRDSVGNDAANLTNQAVTNNSTVFLPSPVAHWTVVPNQVVDSTLTVGIVAFHIDGIQKVGFSIAGGAESDVTTRTKVTGTNSEGETVTHHEYQITFDASLYADGAVTIDATVYPNTGTNQNRTMGQITLYANSGSTITPTIIYVATTGNDSAPGDGTSGNPYATIMKAVDVCTPGDIIEIQDEGTHTVNTSLAITVSSTNYWTTIRGASGLNADNVIIRSTDETTLIRPKHSLLKWQHLTFDFANISQIYPEANDSVWMHDVKFTNSNGVGYISAASEAQLIRGTAGGNMNYATESSSTQNYYGFTDFEAVINCYCYQLVSDVYQNSRLILNSSAEAIDGALAQVEASGTHTGANNQATVLTDSTKTWTTNEWVGYKLFNTTDGSRSSGTIVSNTANTVTVSSMALGTDNDFDTNDSYEIKVDVHPDIYQTFGDWENLLIYNLTGLDCGEIQNIFLDKTGSSFTDCAFVNIGIENNYTTADSAFRSQFSSATNHMLLWNIAMPNQQIWFRDDQAGAEQFVAQYVDVRNFVVESELANTSALPSNVELHYGHVTTGSHLTGTTSNLSTGATITLTDDLAGSYDYGGTAVASIESAGVAIADITFPTWDSGTPTNPVKGSFPQDAWAVPPAAGGYKVSRLSFSLGIGL